MCDHIFGRLACFEYQTHYSATNQIQLPYDSLFHQLIIESTAKPDNVVFIKRH